MQWVVDEVGFEAVDAGSREDSSCQRPSTPAYCRDCNAEETCDALAAAEGEAAIAKRDRLPEQVAKLGKNPTREEVIAASRKANAI